MLRDRIFQIFRIWALKVGDPYDKKIVESNRYRTGISKKYFELTQIYKIYECKLWILFLKITKDNWCCRGHHDTNSSNILKCFLSLHTHMISFSICVWSHFSFIYTFSSVKINVTNGKPKNAIEKIIISNTQRVSEMLQHVVTFKARFLHRKTEWNWNYF